MVVLLILSDFVGLILFELCIATGTIGIPPLKAIIKLPF
jgi:hypothetical protein